MTPEQYVHFRDRISLLKARSTAALLRLEKMSPDAGDVHVPTASPQSPKGKKKPYPGKAKKAMKNSKEC